VRLADPVNEGETHRGRPLLQPTRIKERPVPRDWRVLTCEYYLHGVFFSGSVREVQAAGFIAETNEAFEPGTVVELRLLGGPMASPVYLRCIAEASEAQPGRWGRPLFATHFRLLEFSRDYAQFLFRARDKRPRESMPPRNRQVSLKSAEREWIAELAAAESGTGKRHPQRASSRSTEWEEYEPLTERAGVPLFEDGPPMPEAVVIDDGELENVLEILWQLGVKTDRRSDSPSAAQVNWVPPRRLLVMTEKRAVKMQMPLDSLDGDFVSVVVGDSNARTIRSRLRLLGFRYCISRFVHPIAMSMFFRQAVFDECEQRLAPRVVLGCPIRWRRDWALSKPGMLLDLSPQGCQLLVQDTAAQNDQIRISVPKQSGAGSFSLKGRVVRSLTTAAGTRIAVLFVSPSAKAQDEIQMLLTRSGPFRMTHDAGLVDSGPLRVESTARPEEPRPEPRDRRENARVALQQEIVALEGQAMRPSFTLIGRDLSLDGMRVEPHPSLELDDLLCLALYTGTNEDPLIVSAIAARNDGRAGWLLRFVEPGSDTRERLEHVLATLPRISQMGASNPEPSRVVLGQLVDSARESDDDRSG
jgi:hypothetical protein